MYYSFSENNAIQSELNIFGEKQNLIGTTTLSVKYSTTIQNLFDHSYDRKYRKVPVFEVP